MSDKAQGIREHIEAAKKTAKPEQLLGKSELPAPHGSAFALRVIGRQYPLPNFFPTIEAAAEMIDRHAYYGCGELEIVRLSIEQLPCMPNDERSDRLGGGSTAANG
jgi:hypothetical protein